MRLYIPGSSSGRTDDSGSSNSGSNPFPGDLFAIKLKDIMDENHNKTKFCNWFERERAEGEGFFSKIINLILRKTEDLLKASEQYSSFQGD